MTADYIGARTLEVMSTAPAYNLWLFKQISPFLSGQVCEIGAGTGTFTQMLIDSGLSVTAVDIDTAYLKLITDKLPQAKILKLDLEASSLPRNLHGKFDTIVAINVIEHLSNDVKTLSHLYNLLRHGGKAIILVPAHPFAFSPFDQNLGHYRRYTHSGLINSFTSSGFRIISIKHINILGLLGWVWYGKILRQPILPAGPVKLFNYISQPFLSLERLINSPIGLSLICVAQKI